MTNPNEINFNPGGIIRKWGVISEKTHCLKGHEYTSENTYYRKDKNRSKECRMCMSLRKHKRTPNTYCEVCGAKYYSRPSRKGAFSACLGICSITAKVNRGMSLVKGGWNKGISHIPEDSKMVGSKNAMWKGGVTPLHMKIRNSLKYARWRKSVFERDEYTCQECGKIGGYLNADHIEPFSLFPDLRFDINNGRTLCLNCHKQTPTYGGKIKQYGKPQYT